MAELTIKDLEAVRDAMLKVKVAADQTCPICGKPVYVFPDYSRATACWDCLKQREKLFGGK